MAVQVESEPTFNAGKPSFLFKGNYVLPDRFEFVSWDIHPIDNCFLMKKPAPSAEKTAATSAPSKINIVLNWFEELKQRVPVP